MKQKCNLNFDTNELITNNKFTKNFHIEKVLPDSRLDLRNADHPVTWIHYLRE